MDFFLKCKRLLWRLQASARPAWHGAAVSKNTTRVTMEPHCLDMQPYCSSSGSSSTSANANNAVSAPSRIREGSALIAAVRSGVHSDLVHHLQLAEEEKSCAQPIYDLAAVVHHSGNLDGGHYTAQCRHPGSSLWHKFDDAAVADTTVTSVSASAYILFYVRRQ